MKKIKKIIFTICILAAITGIILFFLINNTKANRTSCAFCDPIVLSSHTFYEDNLILGLCSHKPVTPGHCLLIPKRHIGRFEELNDSEFIAIKSVLNKLNAAQQKIRGPLSYLIMQKNGAKVGQTVPHVHVHYIPTPEGDGSLAIFGLLGDFFITLFKKPLSTTALKKEVTTLRQALII